MSIWLNYPRWSDDRTRLAVNPFKAIHHAHTLDIATMKALEELGMPQDIAKLCTSYYDRYADRVGMAFAKALFMGGQNMTKKARSLCNKIFDHPNKAHHYLNTNSEWVLSCCSEWVEMTLPGFVIPPCTHPVFGPYPNFQDLRSSETEFCTQFSGSTQGVSDDFGPVSAFCYIAP